MAKVSRGGVHLRFWKISKRIFFSPSRLSSSPNRLTPTDTGIIAAVSPRTPMIPEWRSWCRAPTIAAEFANLAGENFDARTVNTSASAIGISIGPTLNSACPKANTRSPSL